MGLSAAAVASLAATVITTGVTLHQQSRQADKQGELEDQKQAMADAQARDDRRRQTREARIRRAQVQQSAINTGVEGSSGELGAVGALSSSLGENFGTIGSNMKAGGQMSAKVKSISDIGRNIQTTQAVGGLTSSIFANMGSTSIFEQASAAPQQQQSTGGQTTLPYHRGLMGG